MLRLICDRTAGTLLSGFDSRRRNVTLAETWRPSEESSLTVQFYGVESDSSGRLEPYDLTASGDKPSLLLGSSTFSATEGALVLSFGGDDSAEIDLDTISATSIAYALNQAPAIGAAGNVNVRELPNDGFGRGFLITFREVGSRSGFTATLKDDAPPLTAALTVVQEGTASLREVLLLTVRGEQFASLTGASWSALSAPTVAITQVTAGSVSAAARYTLSCGTSSTAEPRRWTTRLVFSGGTTTLIGNESSPSDIEQAINTALSSTGAWRVRKTGANTYDLEAQAVGTNTVTVTDSTVSYWPGLTGTLSADTVALAANIAGKSKIEAVATIDTGTGEPLYREYLPVYAALLPDSSTTPMVYARINSTASAPTATDDDSEGYGLFSLWIDTSGPKSYICVDNTTDSAVWQELSDAAADGDVVGPNSATDSTVATFDGTTGKLLKASSVTVPARTGTLALLDDIEYQSTVLDAHIAANAALTDNAKQAWRWFLEDLETAGILDELVDAACMRSEFNTSTAYYSLNNASATIRGTVPATPSGAMFSGSSSNTLQWTVTDGSSGVCSLVADFRNAPGLGANTSPIGLNNSNGAAQGGLLAYIQTTAQIYTGGGGTADLSSNLGGTDEADSIHRYNATDVMLGITTDNTATPTVKGYVNTRLIVTDSSGPVQADNALNRLMVGARQVTSSTYDSPYEGTVGSWALFNRVLTDAEMLAAHKALRHLDLRRINLIVAGDSRTAQLLGSASDTLDNWPIQWQRSADIGSRMRLCNTAKNGWKAQDLASSTYWTDRTAHYAPNSKSIEEAHYFIWYGANDLLASRTGAQIWADLQTSIRKARLAGMRVYCFTDPDAGTTYTAGQQTERAALNVLIRAGLEEMDGIIDLDAALPPTRYETHWEDQIHFNAAGNKALATWMAEGAIGHFPDRAYSGFVTGPVSATDNRLASFDGTTGKLIQDAQITSSSGTMTILGFNANLAAAATAGTITWSPTAGNTALAFQANAGTITLPASSGTLAKTSDITAAAVGLGNCDNTSDANKPVSTATQTALDAKLATAGGTMTGPLVIADGSVGTATGAIYFANDTDCGIARQGTNHIRLFASANAQFVLQMSGSDAACGWAASPQYRIAATGECYQLMQDFSGSHCGVRLQNAATKYYVRAASSQTANILEIQNSAGTVLAAFNSAGNPVIPTKTPASASDTGTSGQIAWDSDYIYVCTAANTWKRAALSTW